MTSPIVLDPDRPLASLREAAGLSQGDAADLLGVAPSTVATPEQRGPRIHYAELLRRAEAYGFEAVEIRVRRKATP